ncbi:MAG: nucleotidyltransferase family protein [Caldilineales bacterium]
MSQQVLALSQEQLAEFCRRWKITELALFGSALGNDFGPDSDVDLLVSFTDDASWGLLDHIQMERELEKLVGREVDLVTERAVRSSANWLRRRAILDTSEVFYAAGVKYGEG